MSYKVTKKGPDDWADLKGKRITFKWSDGWEEYDPTLVFSHTESVEEMGMIKYYVLDEDGGGYAFWESTEVEVTVHEPYRWEGGKPPTDEEREVVQEIRTRRRAREEGLARGGVDDWLRHNYPDHTRVGSDGLDEIVTLSLTREEAKALEKNLESVLAKLRARLTQDDKPATLEE